jgi:hypothetical protein
MANTAFTSLDQFERSVVNGMVEIANQPGRLRSLINFSYLNDHGQKENPYYPGRICRYLRRRTRFPLLPNAPDPTGLSLYFSRSAHPLVGIRSYYEDFSVPVVIS